MLFNFQTAFGLFYTTLKVGYLIIKDVRVKPKIRLTLRYVYSWEGKKNSYIISLITREFKFWITFNCERKKNL